MLVPAAHVNAVRSRHVVSRVVRTPHGVRLRVLSPEPPLPDAVPVTPDLEDVYLDVIQRSSGLVGVAR